MKDRIRLPLHFNPGLLQKDLEALEANRSDWINHFVTQNYEGSWSVIPLRGPKGAEHPVRMIYSDPACDSFEDTPFLKNSPYLEQVLGTFQCELHAARLMKLSSGSRIKEHQDHDLDYEQGVIRVHIPVKTNPHVEFYLNGRMVKMAEGECWYLKLSDPHHVNNQGPDRVHLVIDMKVNPWIESLFLTDKNEI